MPRRAICARQFEASNRLHTTPPRSHLQIAGILTGRRQRGHRANQVTVRVHDPTFHSPLTGLVLPTPEQYLDRVVVPLLGVLTDHRRIRGVASG